MYKKPEINYFTRTKDLKSIDWSDVALTTTIILAVIISLALRIWYR